VPIRYGQVFGGYAASLGKCIVRLAASENSMLELGIEEPPSAQASILIRISKDDYFGTEQTYGISVYQGNSIMLHWSMAGFVDVSNALRIMAIELNKISNEPAPT